MYIDHVAYKKLTTAMSSGWVSVDDAAGIIKKSSRTAYRYIQRMEEEGSLIARVKTDKGLKMTILNVGENNAS